MDFDRLPVISLRNMVVLPVGTMPIIVGRDKTINAVNKAQEEGRKVFLTAQKRVDGHPEAANLYRIGTIGRIETIIRLPNNIMKVIVTAEERAEVLRFSTNPTFVEAWTELKPIDDDQSESTQALYRRVVDVFRDYVSISDSVPEDIIKGIQLKKPTGLELISTIVFHVKPSYERVQAILERPTLKDMLKLTLEVLMTEVEIERFKAEVDDRVSERMGETQKNHILRQKLHAIQQELGEDSFFQQEIDKYHERMQKKSMPKEAESMLHRELTRLSKMHPVSAEATVSRTFIEWMLDLPWYTFSEDEKDLKDAWEILEQDHYNLKEVKKRIVEHLALVRHTGSMRGPILCLVGPPGVGKTSLAKSIANALKREFVKTSLGGVHDEAEIRGHRRTYVGALPGRIINGMIRAKVTNPVFLIDEIDKLVVNERNDPSSALLEVLDPEQNQFFSDHYVEEDYDLSKVLFITTANYLQNIPAPLRDRMEVIELSSYTEIEKFHIARNFLVDKQVESHGLEADKFHITDGAIKAIINDYTREAGVRQLERLLGSIVRKAIKEILIEKKDVVKITKDNLNKYLGKTLFKNNKVLDKDMVGVVTGLAYTQAGGDTLEVEATYYEGKNNLVLTGNLGNVMKESAMAALSYVRTNAEKLHIDLDKLEKNDFHIHVPEGAIPKDGPSAGVTMATALISVLSDIKVNRYVGMTGEITLNGRVLPIGGLKEKAIAAARRGLKDIVIPKGNEKDVEDIPKEVRDKLNIHYATNLDEVLKIALVS